MKLKKIRVRLKDLHHGKILYVAEPRCGIEAVQVIGKPYRSKYVNSLFIKVKVASDYSTEGYYEDNRSLSDMGVYNQYGYRRTFHTMKQAQQYVTRIKNTAEFKTYWERHLRNCDMLADYPIDYED